MMTASGVLWSGFDYRLQGGFDTDCSFVAVLLNQLREEMSQYGSTNFEGWAQSPSRVRRASSAVVWLLMVT